MAHLSPPTCAASDRVHQLRHRRRSVWRRHHGGARDQGLDPITHLPKQPEYVRGVLNLRGVMVPIVDLRCRLGEGLTETTPMHVVIMVQIGARRGAFWPTGCSTSFLFGGTQVQPVPRISAGRRNYLSGLVTVDGPMIALLDLPQLLAEDAAERSATP